MNAYPPSSFTGLTPSAFKPLQPKTFLNSKDFWFFFIAGLLQIIGMIVITFRNPANGDTSADTTFLWVGWGVFALGTGILLFLIFTKVKFD